MSHISKKEEKRELDKDKESMYQRGNQDGMLGGQPRFLDDSYLAGHRAGTIWRERINKEKLQ